MQISNCTRCGLSKTRTNIVIKRGSDSPDILFIGEAPGREEDLEGFPFVGRSGQLLNRAIAESGIDSFAIVNIIKCRPPDNRKPSMVEIAACSPWLEMQLLKLNPMLIVCLGGTALQYFVPEKKITEAVSYTSDLAWFIEKNNLRLSAVFHPSYVLRGSMPKEDYFQLFRNLKQTVDYLKGKHDQKDD